MAKYLHLHVVFVFHRGRNINENYVQDIIDFMGRPRRVKEHAGRGMRTQPRPLNAACENRKGENNCGPSLLEFFNLYVQQLTKIAS